MLELLPHHGLRQLCASCLLQPKRHTKDMVLRRLGMTRGGRCGEPMTLAAQLLRNASFTSQGEWQKNAHMSTGTRTYLKDGMLRSRMQ
jgi:hypothetical protein